MNLQTRVQNVAQPEDLTEPINADDKKWAKPKPARLHDDAKQAKEAELRNLARLARADRVNLNIDNKTSVENGETFSFLALSL